MDSLRSTKCKSTHFDPILREDKISKFTTEPKRLKNGNISKKDMPPITRSLNGILKGCNLKEEDYKKYLEEKYK